MGNRASIATHVAKEIERLNEVLNAANKKSGEEQRKFLVLDQLPKMTQMREQSVDLQHIGILFVLDKGLKGWFDERGENCVVFFPFLFFFCPQKNNAHKISLDWLRLV